MPKLEDIKVAPNAKKNTTPNSTCPPMPPQGRMPLEQRAKIFIPFDPLKGFQEALRKKEQELESEHPHMKPLL